MSIDKLAMVSRVLFEQRIIDQRKEIEELKVCLFWRDHNLDQLIDGMKLANKYHIRCTCNGCKRAGRTFELRPEDIEHYDCIFCPWFEEQIAKCGMVVRGPNSNERCHIYEYDHPVQWGFYHFTYGDLLRDAPTIGPEYLKLHKLMQILGADEIDCDLYIQ